MRHDTGTPDFSIGLLQKTGLLKLRLFGRAAFQVAEGPVLNTFALSNGLFVVVGY